GYTAPSGRMDGSPLARGSGGSTTSPVTVGVPVTSVRKLIVQRLLFPTCHILPSTFPHSPPGKPAVIDVSGSPGTAQAVPRFPSLPARYVRGARSARHAAALRAAP